MRKRWILYTFSLAAFMIVAGLGCKGPSDEAQAAAEPITLTYWSVSHDSRLMKDLIAEYALRRSYVNIKYRRYRPEEFERELLEALAEDRGPDVITAHNTWMGKYQSKLLPAPANLEVANVYIKGKYSKERVVEVQNIPTPTSEQIDRTFVTAVKGDVIRADERGRDRLWGLPMSLDTMVLYYNQDLLDAAGIPQAPSSWAEFQEAVVATTRYDTEGNIVQAGAAIGTGDNVDRAGDIAATLMLQNGAALSDTAGRVRFHQIPDGFAGEESPAVEALRFYTDFANPTKQVYAWNSNQEQALEAFTRNKVTFFFGYAYHIPLIKARAPKLNYRVLQMPQLNPNVPKSLANYWIEAVTKKTQYPNEAWDFIMFLTEARQADPYSNATRKPTALRNSVNKQLEDPDMAPFAASVLNAESWYRGRNPAVADAAMIEMIDFIHANRALEESEDIYADAVNRAASKVNQSL